MRACHGLSSVYISPGVVLYEMVAGESPFRAVDRGAHLLVSRRFDSSEAVQRLKERASAESGGIGVQTTGLATSFGDASTESAATRLRTALRHLQQDLSQQASAVAVTLAIVIALAIAFVQLSPC